MNSCSSIVALTKSPIETTPMTRPLSTTGRCRTRRSVINVMQSPTERLGGTLTTSVVMIAPTGESFDDRPASTTLREIVALGQDAGDLVAVEDEHRADIVLGHDAECREHGVAGADGVNGPALVPQDIVSRSHLEVPDETKPILLRIVSDAGSLHPKRGSRRAQPGDGSPRVNRCGAR